MTSMSIHRTLRFSLQAILAIVALTAGIALASAQGFGSDPMSAAPGQTDPSEGYRGQPEMDVGDEPGVVPSPEAERLPAKYRRQVVFFRSNEPTGTIVVETTERFLYLVMGNNRALRYGIGVGREGFTWKGLLKVTRKAEWPDWTPPPEMIRRQPYLPRWMAGGPGNPLGARAMYLGTTVYRIHGTNQPHTIGQAVSSGCFRLVNGEVVDLYDRVPVGTKVIIHQAPTL
jgi:lipoprotein-anchoring transpeptidase ErfK/SrfK